MDNIFTLLCSFIRTEVNEEGVETGVQKEIKISAPLTFEARFGNEGIPIFCVNQYTNNSIDYYEEIQKFYDGLQIGDTEVKFYYINDKDEKFLLKEYEIIKDKFLNYRLITSQSSAFAEYNFVKVFEVR